jgi:hypothetical protein
MLRQNAIIIRDSRLDFRAIFASLNDRDCSFRENPERKSLDRAYASFMKQKKKSRSR